MALSLFDSPLAFSFLYMFWLYETYDVYECYTATTVGHGYTRSIGFDMSVYFGMHSEFRAPHSHTCTQAHERPPLELH